MVAAFINEFLGGLEIILRPTPFTTVFKFIPRIRLDFMKHPRAIEMNIGHEEPHRPALGNLPCFVKIFLSALWPTPRAGKKTQPRASKKTARQMIHCASAAEAGNGGIELGEGDAKFVRGPFVTPSTVRWLSNLAMAFSLGKNRSVKRNPTQGQMV